MSIYAKGRASGSFRQPLTAEQERGYIRQFETGTEAERKEAKDELITRNLRLVAHIVKKYNHKDTEDLISIGTIGLIKGIVSYKSDKNVRLATYASRCIDNEILMFLRASKKYAGDCSLSEPIGTDKEGNSVTLEDKLADEEVDVDERIHMEGLCKKLLAAISAALGERERSIIEMRYGLTGGDELTQREVAALLGISRSYVSRIEKRAMKLLARHIDEALVL